MDHLTALKVFRQVAELGSFAQAARELGLSPPAISKNISELEAHLGVRLFNRTTRRVSRTEAGARYHAQVARILDDLDRADASLGPMQSTPSGLLRVAAPLTLTLLKLSAAMPAFLARYPELTVDLQMSDRRVDIIEEGFDVAIRGSDAMKDSSLVARKLMTMRHVVCASPAYLESAGTPAVPADLRRHSSVQFTLSGHADEWEFRGHGGTVRVPISGRYKVTSSLAVRDALLAGFGLSLVPRIYVEDDLAKRQLVTVLDDWSAVETAIYAVYPSRGPVAAKVRAFVDFVVEQLRE
ncbi:LysR family transcriptional regulator [Bradyrhizobium prioriisuperbiae]|uniref:LysR family transcriptional regulator n=1 Tax=Bradyrhizobium prioriisuperbiae TaxID=2854389 RepID=UPI0028E63ED0|nr:LysR family transcriptional regulator [Bradyrhizobium prioritasuperba]